jgi:hypothetical protein
VAGAVLEARSRASAPRARSWGSSSNRWLNGLLDLDDIELGLGLGARSALDERWSAGTDYETFSDVADSS